MISVAFLFSGFSGASLLYFIHHLPQLWSFRQASFQKASPDNIRANWGTPGATEIKCEDRPPPVWPKRLVVVQRRVPDADSGVKPATAVTYYDSIADANLIQITFDQALPATSGKLEGGGRVLWDLELGSKTSYYFYPDTKKCRIIQFPVGILRTDWLRDAKPLGESLAWDGARRVCGWTKLDFIDYYADYETGEPTGWYFQRMKARWDVLYYAPNQTVRDEAMFDPPDFCQSKDGEMGGNRRGMTKSTANEDSVELDISAEEMEILALMRHFGRD